VLQKKKRTASADERGIARLRKVLPQVLGDRPEFAAEVEIHLRHVFATRQEVQIILERLDREQKERNELFYQQQAEWKRWKKFL
jgi:hypothetical protein